MNFIAGNLLYHAEEYLAFWLLVMFFELFELRDIYLPSINNLNMNYFLKISKKINRITWSIKTLPNFRAFDAEEYVRFLR